MTGFIQIIESKTSMLDEMMALSEEWRQKFPDMGPSRVLVCADRDNEGTIVTVVEFPSYEAAMKNNDDPVTAEFAERMQALSDAPPTFRNLDLVKIRGAVAPRPSRRSRREAQGGSSWRSACSRRAVSSWGCSVGADGLEPPTPCL